MREIDRSYSVLGVRPGTPPEELKRVYRELVREWHPDQFPRDTRQHRLAEEKLKAINVAYEMVLAHGSVEIPEAPERPRPSPPPPPPNGYSARSAYASYGGTAAAEPEEETRSAGERAAELYHEGMAHFRQGQMQEAISALVQSVCLYPNNPEAHFTLGLAYRLRKLPAKAAAAFKQVIRLQPHSEEAHNNLAQSYIEAGDYRDAVYTCAQFLRKRPDAHEVRVTLGEGYRRTGRFPQAVEALTGVLRNQPDYAEAQYQLGETYVSMGDREAAQSVYEALRPLNPDLAVRLLLSMMG